MNVPEKDRLTVHHTLRLRLESAAEAMNGAANESAHFAAIEGLSEGLSTECGSLLKNGRFRIGSAQKALNLFLKYYWCAGWLPEPPHCPFDAIVLRQIKSWDGPTWTVLDSLADYRRLVEKAKEVAGGEKLARWELALYEKAACPLPGGRS